MYSSHIMYTVLVIADSRGRGIQSVIRSRLEGLVRVHVIVHPGSGARLAVAKTLQLLRELEPDLVILLTGICDITTRNGRTKRIDLRHHTVHDLVSGATGAFRDACMLLRAEGTLKISVATITGVNLVDCNSECRRGISQDRYNDYVRARPICEDQKLLNEAIICINKEVVKFNKSNSSQTTWVAGLVHAYFKGAYHHYYKRLFDGCHPDESTKQAWAAQIIKSIMRLSKDNSAAHPTSGR